MAVKQILIKKIILIAVFICGILFFYFSMKGKIDELKQGQERLTRKIEAINTAYKELDSIASAVNVIQLSVDAYFRDSVIFEDNKTAKVRFEPQMKNADIYEWNFGDKQTLKDRKPVQEHVFNLSSKRSFIVILKVTKDGNSDTDTLKIVFTGKDEPVSAAFDYNAMDYRKYWLYRFRATTRDGDNYRWLINDTARQEGKSPDFIWKFPRESGGEYTVKLILTKSGKKAESTVKLSFVVKVPDVKDSLVSMVFRLRNNESVFCREDGNSYEFETIPPGGRFERSDGGAAEYKNGRYYFTPNKTNTGISKITFSYILNKQKSSYTVEFLNASFSVKRDSTNTKGFYNFTFSAAIGGYDSYNWRFSDTDKKFPSARTITRLISSNELGKGISLKLTVKRGNKECVSAPYKISDKVIQYFKSYNN